MEFDRMRFPSGDSRIPVIVSPWPANVKVASAFLRSQALMTFSIPAVYTYKRDICYLPCVIPAKLRNDLEDTCYHC
jgi:hypothetical protein